MKIPSKTKKRFVEWCEAQGLDPQKKLEEVIEYEASKVFKKPLPRLICGVFAHRPPFWIKSPKLTDRMKLRLLKELKEALFNMDAETHEWKTLYHRIQQHELDLGLTPTVIAGVPNTIQVRRQRALEGVCVGCGNPKLISPKYCKICVKGK